MEKPKEYGQDSSAAVHVGAPLCLDSTVEHVTVNRENLIQHVFNGDADAFERQKQNVDAFLRKNLGTW